MQKRFAAKRLGEDAKPRALQWVREMHGRLTGMAADAVELSAPEARSKFSPLCFCFTLYFTFYFYCKNTGPVLFYCKFTVKKM